MIKTVYILLLILFSNLTHGQFLEKRTNLSKEILKSEKIDWLTKSINRVRDQFKVENFRFKIKLKRLYGYDIEDVAFEEFSFFTQINIYEEIFAQIEATTYVYATISIRI